MWLLKSERNFVLMSDNKKDDELKKKIFGIFIFIAVVFYAVIKINNYFSFPTSYENVHSYVIDGQKMVLQEKYLNHNFNDARYRVKVYSLLQDGKGLPTWKYVKTVDYGKEKPQLAYQNEIK